MYERWRIHQAAIAHLRANPLVGTKDEQLLMNDGAAGACAELVHQELLLGIGFVVKEIASVEHIVAVEVVAGSMEVVGPRLQSQVHDRARLPAVFGGWIFF